MNLEICPVCYENFDYRFRQPKILPCSHNLCLTCLERILKEKNSKCPLDRQLLESSLKCAEDFPTNDMLIILNQHAREHCLIHQGPLQIVLYPEGKRSCQDCLRSENLHPNRMKRLTEVEYERLEKLRRLRKKMSEFESKRDQVDQLLKSACHSTIQKSSLQFDILRRCVEYEEMEEWARIGLTFHAKKLKTEKDLSDHRKIQDALQEKVWQLEDPTNFSLQIEKEERLPCLTDEHIQKINSELQDFQNILASSPACGRPHLQEIRKTSNHEPTGNPTLGSTLFEQNINTIRQLIQIEKFGERIVIKPREWSIDGSLPYDILENPTLWKNYKNVTISFFKDPITEPVMQSILMVWNQLPWANNLKLNLSNPSLNDQEMLLFWNRRFWARPNMKVFEVDLQKVGVSSAVFEHIARVVTEGMPDLEYLQLHFSETEISDKALKKLGKRMNPLRNLSNFGLGIYGCRRITDRAIFSIVPHLTGIAENLTSVNFHFGCTRLSNSAIVFLSQEVFTKFQRLTEFHISLNGTFLSDSGVTQICTNLKHAVHEVRKLTILLNKTAITDQGLEILSHTLTPSLAHVEEYFFSMYDTKVTDKGVSSFFASIRHHMLKLESILFNFGKTGITDVSVDYFAENNLITHTTLKKLKLFIQETRITDHSITNFMKKIPDNFQVVKEVPLFS